MYKKLAQENRWWANQASAASKKRTEFKLVTAQQGTSQIKTAAGSVAARAIRILGWLAAAWAWAFTAELVRRVGGGQRSLKRHEFESIELKRGGFGDVF
ncbi:MAG: hypothetical protein U1E10_15965 [Bdellovibrionales bacterium]|nr:hypothetical protein [Bdellovibrionales bacterium]